MTTVGKFGPGSILGAASLLCGTPARTSSLLRRWWLQRSPMRPGCTSIKLSRASAEWCDGQLWPQELKSLLETLIAGSANAEISTLELLQAHYKACRHCDPTAEAIRAAQDEGATVFLSSSWGDASPGVSFRPTRMSPPLNASPPAWWLCRRR